jgi:hypothetical protein
MTKGLTAPNIKQSLILEDKQALLTPQTTEKTLVINHSPSNHQTMKQKQECEALRQRCRQLTISLFLQQQKEPIRSLGITSAIPGEGKTFLSRLITEVLCKDFGIPVTLLECNWENPTTKTTKNWPAQHPEISR